MAQHRILMLLAAIACPVFIFAADIANAGETIADKTEILHIGRFSAADPGDGIPSGWESLNFDKIENHTNYRLVEDNGTTVILAKSDASASGLIRKMRIDPRKYPVIEWRWKATNVYEKGDVTRKSGDDYPARIYIAFEYDPSQVGFFEWAKFGMIKLFYGEYPPIGAITYVWASHAKKGTMAPNAYTDRVKMIVVESGKKNTNTWVSESQNILDDYKAAFGKDSPMISGIAIMTDSDNTGEVAQTFYGDIVMNSTDGGWTVQ